MSYDFSELKAGLLGCEERFVKELSSVHTGRATPLILDGVFIDSYGIKTSISHVSAITTEDARTIRVAPWDKSQIKTIEQAINNANLGVSVSGDEQGLRVFFPELTTERRDLFIKLAKEKLEIARVCVRGERENVWSDISKKEKDGEISEDDKFYLKNELQKIVDQTNSKLNEMFDKKEREIMS